MGSGELASKRGSFCIISDESARLDASVVVMAVGDSTVTGLMVSQVCANGCV